MKNTDGASLATGQYVADLGRPSGAPMRGSPTFIVSATLLALQTGVLLFSLF